MSDGARVLGSTCIEDIAGRGPALELVRGFHETMYRGDHCIAVAKQPHPASHNTHQATILNPETASEKSLVFGCWAYKSGSGGLSLPECNFEIQTTSLGKDFPMGCAPNGFAVALDFSLSLSTTSMPNVCLLSGGTDGGHDKALANFTKIAAKLSPYALYAPVGRTGASTGQEEDDSLFYLYEPQSSRRHLVKVERGPTPNIWTTSPEPSYPPPPSSITSPSHPTNAPESNLGAPVRVTAVESGETLWDYGRSWFLVQYGRANILHLPHMASLPAALRREVHRRCLKAGGFVHPTIRNTAPSLLSGSSFPASRSSLIMIGSGEDDDDEEAHFPDTAALEIARSSLLELDFQPRFISSPGLDSNRQSITVTIELGTSDSELLMDLTSDIKVPQGDESVTQRVHWTAAFNLPFEDDEGPSFLGDKWCSIVVSVEPPPPGRSYGGGTGGGGVLVRYHISTLEI